jgi:hypothetical protein
MLIVLLLVSQFWCNSEIVTGELSLFSSSVRGSDIERKEKFAEGLAPTVLKEIFEQDAGMDLFPQQLTRKELKAKFKGLEVTVTHKVGRKVFSPRSLRLYFSNNGTIISRNGGDYFWDSAERYKGISIRAACFIISRQGNMKFFMDYSKHNLAIFCSACNGKIKDPSQTLDYLFKRHIKIAESSPFCTGADDGCREPRPLWVYLEACPIPQPVCRLLQRIDDVFTKY